MERLRGLMEDAGIQEWGVCAYADVLPLLNVRSKGKIPADAKSVIVMLFGYFVGDYPDRNISRYAIVDDYHTVVRQKLVNLAETAFNLYNTHQFIPFVDSSPVAEVRAANAAGLGDIGLNGQLLNPVYGSYCFIGEIVTTMELTGGSRSPSLCTQCGACLAACPTSALTGAGFDLTKCRSYITQKKGVLTDWEMDQVKKGGFVWGCDCCTDACPVNRSAKYSAVPEFYEDIVSVAGKDTIGKLCETKAYGWRGENVLLRNLRILE